jgi:CubicO group peptidase (beta-lactamase class C family)
MTVQDLLRHSAGLIYGEISRNAPVKEAYAQGRLYSPTRNFDIRDLTPSQQITAFSRSPLAHQPGTVWEYSLASDLLGRVVEAASGQRLADFLEQRLFAPLRMPDSGFWVEGKDLGRVAEPLPTDAAGNRTVRLIDVARKPANDSGGAGAVSTAADYLRFSQMLLSGGKLDGKRVMSRSSIALMTSDHLGDRIKTALTPGEQRARHRWRARFGRRIHMGRIRRYLFLDRSEGAYRRGLHEPGTGTDTRLLPQAVPAAGLCRYHRLRFRRLARNAATRSVRPRPAG